MIRSIEIKNYKSIESLKLKPSRFNVLIGENGAGKTNILEAIVLATNTVDKYFYNDFLDAKSIKDTAQNPCRNIEIDLKWQSGDRVEFRLQEDSNGYCHFVSSGGSWHPSKEFLIYGRTEFSTASWSPAIGLTINELPEQKLLETGFKSEAFAIEDFGAFLNPRLSRRTIQELISFAKKHDRQMFLTTHQPGALDGLDLEDEDQRLFAVSRNTLGNTKIRRINPPKPLDGQEPVDLSEAFLRGYLGALPKDF